MFLFVCFEFEFKLCLFDENNTLPPNSPRLQWYYCSIKNHVRNMCNNIFVLCALLYLFTVARNRSWWRSCVVFIKFSLCNTPFYLMTQQKYDECEIWQWSSAIYIYLYTLTCIFSSVLIKIFCLKCYLVNVKLYGQCKHWSALKASQVVSILTF